METRWEQPIYKANYGEHEQEIGPRCRKACSRRSLNRFCTRPQLAQALQSWTSGAGRGSSAKWQRNSAREFSGLDAAEPLLAIARERVAQGDFRAGEIEELPYSSQTFDVVAGFNSFQFAASPVNALREAGRVSRTGTPVVIAVFGKREDTEAAAYFAALGSLLPPPPPGAPGPFALSIDGALEALVTQAGMTPGNY